MVSKKAKVIFLMPPKTASNSLQECLLDSSIDFDEFPCYYPAPKIHLFLSELIGLFEIDNWEEYKIFQVVRDPSTRFVSTYFHQLKILPKNQQIRIRDMKFNEFANHFYQSIQKPNFLGEFYGDYSFVKEAVVTGKSWGGSRTYLNQVQWNDMGANVRYIKLEDITNDISPLSEQLGVYLPELEKVNSNKENVDYMSMITPRIQNIINEVYHNDFIKLGY